MVHWFMYIFGCFVAISYNAQFPHQPSLQKLGSHFKQLVSVILIGILCKNKNRVFNYRIYIPQPHCSPVIVVIFQILVLNKQWQVV